VAELIQAGGKTFEDFKPITYMWNKEQLPRQWMEFVIVPVYKKSGKTDWEL
jgi:hypothetical protein